MTKLKAAGMHFMFSVLVISLALLFIYFVWYDQIYIQVSGVIEPIKLMILVDVVLGPILTFLVYRKNKPSLKFDLSFIVLLQLCALSYGLYSINLGKPSMVIFRDNSFEILANKSFDKSALKPEVQQQLGLFKKPFIGKIEPINFKKHHSLLVQLDSIEALAFNELNHINHKLATPGQFPSVSAELDNLTAQNLSPASAYLSAERAEAISGKSIEQLNEILTSDGYVAEQMKFVMLIYGAEFYVAAVNPAGQGFVKVFTNPAD